MKTSFSLSAFTAGALATAIVSAMASERDREAALVTFLVTASGMTFFGIGGAFWGLLAGGAIYLWEHRGDEAPQTAGEPT